MASGEMATFAINTRASIIPPPCQNKQRGLRWPLWQDERVAVKELLPVVQVCFELKYTVECQNLTPKKLTHFFEKSRKPPPD